PVPAGTAARGIPGAALPGRAAGRATRRGDRHREPVAVRRRRPARRPGPAAAAGRRPGAGVGRGGRWLLAPDGRPARDRLAVACLHFVCLRWAVGRRIAFVADPLPRLDPATDTSVGLMLAAQDRGAEVWLTEVSQVEAVNGRARALARPLRLAPVGPA